MKEERRFIETFPGSEIAILISNESVGLFSFALIDQGSKIRMKDGGDGEYYNDVGAALPEEKEVFSEEIFEEGELEEMKDNGMTEEEIHAMIAFEASWRVPDQLAKRYLGEHILSMDTDKVKLTMFSS